MDPFEAIRSACALGNLPSAGVLVVGFSGGPDSLALLHALCTTDRWNVVAVHVDHRLRAESPQEANWAQQQAECLGADFRSVSLKSPPPNEEVARIARHRALAEQARAFRSAVIVLGHHADDQLETMLMRLVRGTSAKGLRGMRPLQPGPAGIPLCRPLLASSRAEIEAYCSRHALQPLHDPTNVDPTFTIRNLVRQRLLPVLREVNPQAAFAADRLATLLYEDDQALEELACGTASKLAMRSPDGSDGIALAGLRRLPAAIARRVVRQLAGQIDYRQTKAILAFASAGSPAHLHLPGGIVLARHAGCLWAISRQSWTTSPPGAAECRRC
ncbi:MAG: tRNA lysidine(34) synthetase TilS, partial [Cyanobacteria bacterium REEB65]|nr:tRNA lysidine(34) synthetase TilS [Cyanobacteria bacterium REEB65]